MKEIVVISGKGGTGKTSITASFAALAANLVIADCDVDASDMHLITDPETSEKHSFMSGVEAVIDQDKCVGCGKCAELCRFNAISTDSVINRSIVESHFCEGCGVCTLVCPQNCIELRERLCGEWYVSDTRLGTMVHARLGAGGENSGKLVAKVRKEAGVRAKENGSDLIIIDGPPGIACPVIASVTGVDAIVCITEPSLSGLHDLKRVMELSKHFRSKLFIVINRWDINRKLTEKIEEYAGETGAEVLGRVPVDGYVNTAQLHRRSVVEISDSGAAQEIKYIWEKLCQRIL